MRIERDQGEAGTWATHGCERESCATVPAVRDAACNVSRGWQAITAHRGWTRASTGCVGCCALLGTESGRNAVRRVRVRLGVGRLRRFRIAGDRRGALWGASSERRREGRKAGACGGRGVASRGTGEAGLGGAVLIGSVCGPRCVLERRCRGVAGVGAAGACGRSGGWDGHWAPRESLRRGDGEVSWTTRLCRLSGYLLRGRAGLVRSDGGLPGGDVERAASGEDGVGREARGKEKGKRDGMGGTCGWRSGARMDGWHGSLRSRPVRGSGRRWTGGGGCS